MPSNPIDHAWNTSYRFLPCPRDMIGMDAYLGEILALAAAVVWAFAVIMFKKSGEAVHPIGLNFFKGALAATLLVPTIWIFGETLFRDRKSVV